MKRVLVILLLTLPAYAGTPEAYAIGFGAGIAFKLIPFTNRHVVMPATRAVQHTIRPLHPADDIERQNRKEAKLQRKAEKARRRAAKRHE